MGHRRKSKSKNQTSKLQSKIQKEAGQATVAGNSQRSQGSTQALRQELFGF